MCFGAYELYKKGEGSMYENSIDRTMVSMKAKDLQNILRTIEQLEQELITLREYSNAWEVTLREYSNAWEVRASKYKERIAELEEAAPKEEPLGLDAFKEICDIIREGKEPVDVENNSGGPTCLE
jgi:LPS O-antigen subunit length determinant protein (WzzB/FepE family)